MPTATLPVFRIDRADWNSNRQALRSVREAVFIQELGTVAELEWDQTDTKANHLLASSVRERAPIGILRWLPYGLIDRVAVLPQWRGRGIGGALVASAVRTMRQDRRATPGADAPANQLEFFRALGFEESDPDSSASHQKLRRHLTLQHPDSLIGPDLSSRILGETRGRLILTHSQHLALAASRLSMQARRRIDILTHDLQPDLYDQDDFLEAARQLTLERQGRLPLRILVVDPGPAIRRGHRLIELTRLLSSDAQIRAVPPDWAEQCDQFLLCDEQGHCLTRRRNPRQTLVDFSNDAETRRLGRLFEAIWERSDSHPGLRRLHL